MVSRPAVPPRWLRSAARYERAPDRGEDGFILLESLVAMSLITVILAALGTFTITTVRSTNDLRARQAATQIATSTMATLSAVPPSELVSGHDPTSVAAQFSAAPDAVRDSLRADLMTPAVQTPNPPAGSGATATVPTVPVSQTVNNVVYAVNTYLGKCVVASPTADCVASATGVTYVRAVVAVTWSGRGCTGGPCAYVTSTLINADADPVFKSNPALAPAAPVVKNPGAQISTVGAAVTLQLMVKPNTGVDPFAWSVLPGTLPAGLTMDANGFITGTPTTVAPAAPVTVTVTDVYGRTASDSFQWTVLAAPTITTPATQRTPRGRAVTLPMSSTCPNSPCTFTMSNAPDGLSINATTGVVSGTPTTSNTYRTVTITITDAASVAVSTAPFTWKVLAQAPTVGDPGTTSVTVGRSYSIPIPYTCPTPTCTITLDGAFPGATLTSSTSSSTNPTAFTTPGDTDLSGMTNLSLGKPTTQSTTAFAGPPDKAVDGNTDGVYADGFSSHTNTQAQPWWQVDLGAPSLVRAVRIWNRTDCCDTRLSNFYVFTSQTTMTGKTAAQLLADPTVTVQEVSGLAGQPSIDIPAQSAARYVRVQLSGTDYLTLSEVQVLGTPDTGSSVTVAAASGTVYATGTLPASAVPSGASKNYTPKLTITDFAGTSTSSATGTWTANTLPRLVNPGPQAVETRQGAAIQMSATCPYNGTSATCTQWSATAQPKVGSTPITLNISSTGRITFTAPFLAGSYTITVTVTDSAGQTDTVSFPLTVQTFNLSIPNKTTPRPPIGTTTVVTLDLSTLVTPTASYTYAMSGAPSWLTLDPATGILTATITNASASDPSITITVTSTASSTSTESTTFAWYVS